MRELIVRDDRELRRLNQAIARLDERPAGDRLRLVNLMTALVSARDEIEAPRQRLAIARRIAQSRQS